MPPRQPKYGEIAALFNDCIEEIRNEVHDGLEQLVIDWLKDARLQLMREIEAQYHALAQTRGCPTEQPAWALDPSATLFFSTASHAPILRPYSDAIVDNLKTLMDDCGFIAEVRVTSWFDSYSNYSVAIRFPSRLTDAPRVPRTLRIEDAFSNGLAVGEHCNARAFTKLLGPAPANDTDTDADGDEDESQLQSRQGTDNPTSSRRSTLRSGSASDRLSTDRSVDGGPDRLPRRGQRKNRGHGRGRGGRRGGRN